MRCGWNGILALGVALFVAGCGLYEDLEDELTGGSDDDSSSNVEELGAGQTSGSGQTADTGSPSQPPPASPHQVPANFAGVHWLHTDVSGWAETATLNASIGGGRISLDYSKARVWPARDGLNANPWVFVYRDNRWYAATFEWFRFGQTSKPTRTVNGDHIKRRPLHDFRPRSGEVYGFMVSGLARDSKRNVRERTPVVMLRWP